MAVVCKYSINVQMMDAPFKGFDSGIQTASIATLTQLFGCDTLVPDQTVDMPISLQGVARAGYILFLSDQPIYLKLLPYGTDAASTTGFQLLPNVPSVIGVQNIAEIFVSNATGQQARLVLQGAGVQATP